MIMHNLQEVARHNNSMEDEKKLIDFCYSADERCKTISFCPS